MSTTRRFITILLSVITGLLTAWTAFGWVGILAQGRSWSDAIGMIVFSAVLLALALVCAALWMEHSRGAALGFGILSGLAAISLVASFVA